MFEEVILLIDFHLKKYVLQDQYIIDLKKTLNTLKYNNLFAKLSKCKFFKSSLTFLGHIISNQKISSDFEKVKAVVDLLCHTDTK